MIKEKFLKAIDFFLYYNFVALRLKAQFFALDDGEFEVRQFLESSYSEGAADATRQMMSFVFESSFPDFKRYYVNRIAVDNFTINVVLTEGDELIIFEYKKDKDKLSVNTQNELARYLA